MTLQSLLPLAKQSVCNKFYDVWMRDTAESFGSAVFYHDNQKLLHVFALYYRIGVYREISLKFIFIQTETKLVNIKTC